MTTIATIVKANATVIKTACGITAESTSKGVPGQFDKLVDLINQLPEGEFFIEAEKIKGVFKALGENSKDCNTFKFVLACKGWELVQVEKDIWFICRPEGDIVLINGSYVEPTQPEEVEMKVEDNFNFKELPFKEQSDINCLLLSIKGKTFPSSLNDIEDAIFKASCNEDEKIQQAIQELEDIVRQYRPSQIKDKVKTYPVIVYTGEPKLPTSIQLGVVYSTISVETDQGVKEGKFLYSNTGIVTCKGTKFESVEALIVAVQTAFKVETQEVSETTQQPQEVAMETKSLTFCQLMKAEWIPSKDTWEAGNLVARMRATWKSGKYATDDRQAVFMKEFVEQVNILPQGIEMPNSAFLTAYEIVKEKLTGIKTPVEYPETIGKITDEEAVENFEADLPQKGVLTTGTIIPVQGVALPDHLKAFVVKQEVAQEEQDLVNHIHSLEESILKRCESEDELTQESVKADEEELQELYKQLRGTLVQVEEKLCEDVEELSGGKVVIDSFGGQKYTIEVFFNREKTLWINTKSGESFTSLYDLCMVQEKEYKDHQLFVNGQLVGGV